MNDAMEAKPTCSAAFYLNHLDVEVGHRGTIHVYLSSRTIDGVGLVHVATSSALTTPSRPVWCMQSLGEWFPH
jgi:hypothetical protein